MVAPVEVPPTALPTSSRFPTALFPLPPRLFRSKRSIVIPRALRAALPPHSLVPSLRPPTRRPNHLRRKLLKTLAPSPPPPPPPPHPVREVAQAPLEVEGGGEEASRALVEEDDPRELQPPLLPLSQDIPADCVALVLEERESALMLRQKFGDQRPFSNAPDVHVPRLLLELSVYLVGLLAVQTVCAVWLFGGANAEKRKNAETAPNPTLGEEKFAGQEVREHDLEFERTVSGIQAMAREARATEAREASEKDEVSGLRGDIVDKVNRRLERLRKRMPRVHFDAKASSNTLAEGDGSKVHGTPAKGFNSSNDAAASRRDLSNGGSQQIDRDGQFKKDSQLPAQRKSNACGYNVSKEKLAGSRDPVVSDLKKSDTFGHLSVPDQMMSEKSRNGHVVGNGRTRSKPVSWELADDSSFGEGIRHKQTDGSNKASGIASKTKKIGTPRGKKHGSSVTSEKSYTNSGIVSTKKEHENLHEKAEDSLSGAINQLWWLKLPYVLAIFLHRGFDRKEFKGFYSLKLDSSSEDEGHSYTITFEDRVDATNFCCLLELYFEDLDDFFAEVVPLSIQEVHDAVKSRTLKVIVVRKGQLQLYAGQPLAEAEMQVRSMLD